MSAAPQELPPPEEWTEESRPSYGWPEEPVTPGPQPLPEEPVDVEPAAGGQRLYGATVAVAGQPLNPVPVVTVGGQVVAQGLIGDQLPPAGLMAVDGVTIRWGHADLYAQPEAATGQLVLFDPSGVWAVLADQRSQPVVLSWTVDVPGGGTASAVYFRGRIGSPVKIRPKTVRIGAQLVRGVLVTLPLVSVLLDAANKLPTDAWPEETIAARRDRIQTWLGPTPTLVVRDYWLVPNVVPYAANEQKSVYDHVVGLYDACGADRLTYMPDSRVVTFTIRADYNNPAYRGHGVLWWEVPGASHVRAGKGVYVRAFGSQSSWPVVLDAAQLEVGSDAGIATRDKLTRVVHNHPTGSVAGFPDQVIVRQVGGVDEAVVGVRSLRLETDVTWDNYATTATEDVAFMAAREGSAWVVPPLQLDTRRTGGFEDLAQVQMLLGGCEVGGGTPPLLFIARSEMTWLGVRPVFRMTGGTITYSRGGWQVEGHLNSIYGVGDHPISWSEIDDGSAAYEVQWWDDDNPRGMHESLTYEDLGYVHRGLNVTTTGPNTGWDF